MAYGVKSRPWQSGDKISFVHLGTKYEKIPLLSSSHFSQGFVARPFKRLPHKASRTERRRRHTCGTSRRLEGAKPYGVGGWIGANE